MAIDAKAQSGRKPQRDPNAPAPQESPVLRVETKEVIVPLLAYDGDGNLLNNLTTREVLVFEDDEPRVVTFLRHEPANIVLVLDLNNEYGTFKNGSHIGWRTEPTTGKPDGQKPMWEKQENYQVIARPATREFADNLIGKLAATDQVAIIQYAQRVQLIQDWTNEPGAALEALRANYRIGLKGRFYDALKLAADKLEERKTGRRIIVLISDGLDSASKLNRQTVATALARSGASLFIVGWSEVLRAELQWAIQRTRASAPAGIDLLGNASKRIAELQKYLALMETATVQLRNWAETSGGELLLPSSYQALTSAPQRLAEAIGAQYSLAFLSDARPGLEPLREIRVLPGRAGLTIRSRRNYWVAPTSAAPLRVGNFVIHSPRFPVSNPPLPSTEPINP